ncbi:uncharacterized mitochondrial protein ymf40 [Physcomitrium patens]|uniref:Domain X domain-containing protein n=1 Tax=Physcomitrium patens TaxID=3218 RepID=A0A2K1KGK5_PHYPA|nr:uncharacterized protein LOC112283893 [Physcomitrium patens]PNR52917.1 hypothetical protein PHYPA_009292 [Physcomitrium patens]|eukprot:XP_024378982.1 uncharacterized protein LOC112283893 [Physcomitrella patens]
MHRLVRRFSRGWTFPSLQRLATVTSLLREPPILTDREHFIRSFCNSKLEFSSYQTLRHSRSSESFDSDLDTFQAELDQIYDNNKRDPGLVNHKLYNLLLEEDMIRLAHRSLVVAAGHEKDFYERRGLVREILKELHDEKLQFEPLLQPQSEGGLKYSYVPPPYRDRVVVEAMRILLEKVYEPLFLDSSHGFRPSRSRHTALQSVRRDLQHHKFALVGRIDSHNFNHHVLIKQMEQKVGDKRFIRLVWKALNAGHGNRKPHIWTVKSIWEGKHEAMTLSTLFSNIYLHPIDCWIRDRKHEFDTGRIFKPTDPLVLNLTCRIVRLQREGKPARAKVLAARKAQLEEKRHSSLSFRKLFYVRYADDLLLSCIARKEDMLGIKTDLEEFLKKDIQLSMSEEFIVTRLGSSHAFFLGTMVSVAKSPEVASQTQLRPGDLGRVSLKAPMEKIIIELSKLGMVSVGGTRPHPVTYLARCSHNEVISYYNWIMRGCCTYYSFVDNFYHLTSYLRLALRSSCVRTLTMKLKRYRSARTYKEFGTECAARYRVPIRNGSVVDDHLSDEERALLKKRMNDAKRLRLDWDDLGEIEKGLLQRFIIPKRTQEPNGDVYLDFRGDYLIFCSKHTEHEETKRALRKLELLPPSQNVWNFKETLVPPPRPRLSVDYEKLFLY